MINNNVIFDIGANSGINGIALALFNPKIKVFAFEGNTKLLNIIKENKKKIEKIFGKKILNYNTRFFYRVIENRLKLKDHIYINYLKLKLKNK